MLPGLGFQEILLLGVIALLVIKPQDLPGLFREMGRFTRKMQGLASEFRQGFDELARQAELDELRREVETLKTATNIPDLETMLTAPPEGDTPAPTVLPEEPAPPMILPDGTEVPQAEFSGITPDAAPETVPVAPAQKAEAT